MEKSNNKVSKTLEKLQIQVLLKVISKILLCESHLKRKVQVSLSNMLKKAILLPSPENQNPN